MYASKTLNWIAVVLAIFALCLSLFLMIGQRAPKLAFVVNGEIMQNYQPAVQAQQQKDALQKYHQAKVDSMQVELNTLQQVLQSGGGKKIEEQIQQKGQFFQQYAQQAQQQLNAFDRQQMDSVYQDINKGVEAFAKEHGYSMILGTLNGNIVYADEADNVTKAVIEYLNKQLAIKE